MRILVLVTAVALPAFAAFAAPRAAAQCSSFGSPCAGGTRLVCRTPPQTGTRWTLCQVSVLGVGCRTSAFFFGLCDRLGTPIPPPIACSTCPTCSLFVRPVLVTVPVANSICLTVPIAQDPSLVGVTLCAQAACALNNCACLSSAQQVTVQ